MSAEKLNLDKYVNFTGFINDRKEVIRYLNNADICVESAPFNEPNNVSSFVKIMEYMAAAKPIVAFDMYETRFSTDGSAILVPPNDVKAFSYAIKELLEDPILREDLGKIGMKRIKDELNWESASINLMAAYKSLFV
jgi:glycosyltransferase involved in cell wall biosynthesis